MNAEPTPDALRLLAALQARSPQTAVELAQRLGKSQSTLSRLLRELSAEVVALGQGRATVYALPQPLLGLPARQPLHWVHADGQVEAWGELTALQGGQVHVRAPGINTVFMGLPWFLTPLRPSGFLGRAMAHQLAPQGFASNPELWPLEQVLFAATTLPDSPGALQLGTMPTAAVALPELTTEADLDRLADAAAATAPAGSSAGGEQAKFLAREPDGRPMLVKFSPPRGTPFGERWHDLLVAEHLALSVLAEHGVAVAASRLVHTKRRTHLVSQRFDRTAPAGRRHVVALDAFHTAFVGGPRQHWAATCQALARQRRVPAETPAQAQALLHFGHLIGNTDMHFGNLSLWVEPADVAAGRGRLAPVYDMLPMRWRPDVYRDEFGLGAFEPDALAMQSAAKPLARDFWQRCASWPATSAQFRALAQRMSQLLR